MALRLMAAVGLTAWAAWAAEPPVVLEAERFAELGGWTVDSQFLDQMGSPYLLAHGLGRPVADASTVFAVASAGEYDVYVRTMNWTARWSTGAAGRFRLVVNGTEFATELGLGDAEWRWARAGRVALVAGDNAVALRDLTGFDGRCDAIAFVRPGVGPDGLDASRRFRGEVGVKEFDFVVVGGGVAGICAAVTAARAGLRTALVHDRPVLGGNNSSEVRVHLGAYANLPPYPRLGDVLGEFAPAAGGNARPAEVYEDELKLRVVKAEPLLELFLDCHADAVTMAGKSRIAAVEAVETRTGRRLRFAAGLFADCTGDGTVGALAGADFLIGREARSTYGESLAPERADAMTMGASVQWYAGAAAAAAEFPVRDWMLRFDEKSCRPGLRGDWDWETGLGRDQIAEAERIRDYGMLVVYSNWAHLRNACSKRAEFADKELKWLSFVAGKRESRRLLGDFVLTQRHLDEKDFQSDGTCATTWTIDQHYPWPESHTGFKGEPFQAESRNHVIWPYPVPYRCFYSRNVDNLFMAGRNISVTHVALGTTRLMRTHGMMGEVVGMAAAVCRERACSPRQVYTERFGELRARMEKGAGIAARRTPQTYNVQRSLDPTIREQHERSVVDRPAK